MLPSCLRGACGVALPLALLGLLDPCQDSGKKPKSPPASVKSVASGEIVDGETGKSLDAVMQGVDVGDGGFCGVVLVASKGNSCCARATASPTLRRTR